MTQLADTIYLVLTPQRARYGPLNALTGARDVQSFKIAEMRKNKPTTRPGEVAVRVNIAVDHTLFDQYIPVVDVELAEGDVFVNARVTAAPQPEEDLEPVEA